MQGSAEPRADLTEGHPRLWVACCFLLTALAGLLSDGIYHEDDLQHFLFARWVRHEPRYLLNEWGRPGFTVLYALPAMIGPSSVGWHACRLLSALLSAATAWLGYRIARHFQLRHAWLAIPLLYLQPLFTRLSLTTLTETPLAFYVALATWLLLKHRPIASAAIIALGPVTRHEAMVLLPLWAIALWHSRSHWLAYPLLPWAITVHNLLAAWWLQSMPIEVFLAPAGATGYGHGTPLTFVPRLLYAAGPLVTALAVMGAIRIPRFGLVPFSVSQSRADTDATTDREPGRYQYRDHRQPIAGLGWLLVSGCILYFAAQTVIYMRGVYSSGGYARFLVPLAPWLAILATAGLQLSLGNHRQKHPTRLVRHVYGILFVSWGLCEIEWHLRPPILPHSWQLPVTVARLVIAIGFMGVLAVFAYVARARQGTPHVGLPRQCLNVLAAILAFAPVLWAIRPLRLLDRHRIIREATAALHERGLGQRPLLSISYWPYYWTERWLPHHPRAWQIDELQHAAPGTIFLWDDHRCPHPDCNLPFSDLANAPTWRLLWTGRTHEQASTPSVALFERLPFPTTAGQ